ncbi:A-kinase anchor protein 12 isoform X2 [Siniperca chuatsi]|nr:A-kinase anchor protein 12 isoform X2 [Siniperca chuatsi]
MEFWPENQGQSPLYSKFGTVPGRNCTHNYHERHQAAHYPLYYGEQQDQGRESSYWTVPGSRTGGAPQEYTNWTDQELTAPTSSHFPFILDRHTQQHQDLEYQPHEARDREWTAAQRAAREYERGFLREAWQRRWEPCSPVRYNREVSTKRSDSSYRELEAWAARYSHSLPRRRRIEAELRGASQGLLESSRAPERDSRSGTDPRVAALQQVLQSANIRESGLWDRGGRQQTPTYYPSQTHATDTSHMLDMKEKTSYQRRMFSQPPGYIAPPPYNSPHKSSPVLHHRDSWEQEGKRQTYWSQPTLRKQDVSVDLQDHRKGQKQDFTKPDGNQKTFPELEELKQQRQETDALQASSPTSIQKTNIQHEGMLSLQQPKVLQAVQNKTIHEEPSSKVIEGRKFRLNKKTGGMTIFCLVSRIAGTTETPSLPLCTLQRNIQNTELGRVSEGLRDSSDINKTHKLADEVDFRASTLTEQSNTSDARNLKAKQKETPTCVESEMLEDNLSNKPETDAVSPEKANTNDKNSTFGLLSVQPVSVKYPLWREPSFTSRAESESSSTCLKANSEEGESDVLHSQEDSAKMYPIDVEVRRLDIKKDTESEDSKGLLVIDTTCVVVKMELIQSPKKEHVHYFGSTPHTEHSPLDIQSTISPECVQSNSQQNRDVTTDQNAEKKPLHINERPETELDSDLMEKKASRGESEISFPCMSSSSISERETLEERAERILGISLHDCITEQQPEEDAMSLLDSCVKDQEVEPSLIKDKDIDDAVEQIPNDTKQEEQSQNQLEDGQTEDAMCLQENDDAKDLVVNEGGQDFAGPEEELSNMSEGNNIDSHLEILPEIEMTEDPLLKSTSEEVTTEQKENHPVENDTSSQHPSQCLSRSTNLSNSSSLSPSLDCEAPNPALSLMLSSSDLISLLYISESNIAEGPDPELIALNSAENLAPYPETSSLPHTPSQQLPSPLPPGSTDFSTSSTPHTDHSPSNSPLDLIDQTAEAVSGAEDQDEKGETSQIINNEISDGLAKDITEELVSQQQFESGQLDDVACVKESNVTDEQQSKEADEDHTDHILEQTRQISKENAVEVNILQQQLECVQAEDAAWVKESYMTEEQLPKDADEDPTGLLEQTISQENVTGSQTQTEVKLLQQQFDNGQEEDASCLKKSYMTEEQSQKEADEDPTDDVMEQTRQISKENAVEVNILQQQLECVQAEDAAWVKESYMTEEQLPKDADEDPTGLLEQTISQENVTGSQTQTEVKLLQQQFDNGQEEDASCLKKSYMTEEQSQKEADEDPTDDVMEQIRQISKENAVEVNILQQQLECVQTEDAAWVKESYMAEEQLPKEADEDPTGLLKQTISQENVTGSQTQTEVKLLQQQFDNGQEEDASCLKKSYMTEEQSQKEADEDPTDDVMEQIRQISKENAIEVNILQQQLECVQTEDVAWVKESYMAEEQLPKEADEDPTGLLEQTISQENVTDSQTQTEVKLMQQQFDNGQEEDASCLKESYMTEEQSQKEADEDPTDDVMEQIRQISKENAIEVNILQQQLECVQTEDVAWVKESYMAEEQLPKEADEDPTSLLEQTISQENVTDSQTQTEVNLLQQQFDNGQEEDASFLKESYMTEEQSQKEADEDPTGLLEQTISKQATDSQTQIEIKILQDTEPQTEPSNSSPPIPSDSDCEAPQPPLWCDVLSPSELPSPPDTSHKSDTEFVSLLEMDSVCPSALNPDVAPAAGIPETLHLDSCEESLQFSSSSSSDSPSVLLPSSTTPPWQQGSGSVSSDLPFKEEPQYPKSLWDAVNRIRKHTAPDSENEEEEVGELWDPESVGEDLGFSDVVVDMISEKIVFDEARQQEVLTEGSVEDVEVGQIQQYPYHEELCGYAEEDTLSCSSASSHGSGDTVIVADEDEVEETPPDAGTESKTENDLAEGEQCCSGEVKDETASKEEEDDGNERITNEFSQSEDGLVEVANIITKAVEMTETEQIEKEEEVFVPSEVSNEGMTESEPVK